MRLDKRRLQYKSMELKSRVNAKKILATVLNLNKWKLEQIQVRSCTVWGSLWHVPDIGETQLQVRNLNLNFCNKINNKINYHNNYRYFYTGTRVHLKFTSCISMLILIYDRNGNYVYYCLCLASTIPRFHGPAAGSI